MTKQQQLWETGLLTALFLLLTGKSLITPSPTLATEIKRTNFSTAEKNTILAQNSRNPKADQLFEEGYQLFQQGTAESLKAALDKLESARQLYRTVGDKEAEAVTALLIGRIKF